MSSEYEEQDERTGQNEGEQGGVIEGGKKPAGEPKQAEGDEGGDEEGDEA